jgi:hypothetical protein
VTTASGGASILTSRSATAAAVLSRASSRRSIAATGFSKGPDGAGLDPVEVEDVADDAVEAVGLGVNRFEEGLLVVSRPPDTSVEEAGDGGLYRGERRLQIVGDRGNERRLHRVGLAKGLRARRRLGKLDALDGECCFPHESGEQLGRVIAKLGLADRPVQAENTEASLADDKGQDRQAVGGRPPGRGVSRQDHAGATSAVQAGVAQALEGTFIESPFGEHAFFGAWQAAGGRGAGAG